MKKYAQVVKELKRGSSDDLPEYIPRQSPRADRPRGVVQQAGYDSLVRQSPQQSIEDQEYKQAYNRIRQQMRADRPDRAPRNS